MRYDGIGDEELRPSRLRRPGSDTLAGLLVLLASCAPEPPAPRLPGARFRKQLLAGLMTREGPCRVAIPLSWASGKVRHTVDGGTSSSW